MKEFLRSGDKVVARPNGLDYELEPGKVYSLKYDDWENESFLEVNDSSLTLPEGLIYSDDDTKFVNKVLSYFKRTNKATTGVLLSGLKGSGKTVMSKIIARNSNLPVIIVSNSCPTRYMTSFFSKFSETEVCVIFDEIDKNERMWNTEDLLGFLDGIHTTGKKLVLLTCNSNSNINEYIMDRCSRIRYYRKFDSLSEESVAVVTKKFLGEEEARPATRFILENFKCISYDNIVSFCEELKEYANDDYESIVKDLNISTNAITKTDVKPAKSADTGDEETDPECNPVKGTYYSLDECQEA